MSIYADLLRWNKAGEKGLVTFEPKLVRKIFERLADPELRRLRFERDSPGLWVRRTKEPIVEVIEIWIHGVGVDLLWGVALPFVPLIRGSRVKLSASPEKNAPLVLLPGCDSRKWPDPFSRIQPRPELLAEDIRKRIPAWFSVLRESFGTFRGLPSLREQLVALRRKYPERKRETAFVDHQYLALAFLHATLGERHEAEETLESTLRYCRDLKPHAAKLRSMLVETLPTRRPRVAPAAKRKGAGRQLMA